MRQKARQSGNNHATVVQRCNITCHTSSNSLMVAQHSHLSMWIILRPQKFVHHSCKYTQRCTMFVLTIVRPSAIESVAHGRLWISKCSKIRRDRRRAENRMQRKRQLVQRWRAIVRMPKSRITKCFKVVVRQLWKGLNYSQANRMVLMKFENVHNGF